MQVKGEPIQRFVLDLEGGEQFAFPMDNMEGDDYLVTRIEVYDGFFRLLSSQGFGSGNWLYLKTYFDIDQLEAATEATEHIPPAVTECIRECLRLLRPATVTSALGATALRGSG